MWQELQVRILDLVKEYYQARHAGASFLPGTSNVPYAGRVFDADERVAAVDATLDFWLTLGPQGAAFQRDHAEYVGTSHALFVNSDSQAKLADFANLTNPPPEGQIERPHDV